MHAELFHHLLLLSTGGSETGWGAVLCLDSTIHLGMISMEGTANREEPMDSSGTQRGL